MTNDRFLEKLAHLPQQLSSLPWWQQNLLEESKSTTSSQPRSQDLESIETDALATQEPGTKSQRPPV